ncbi:MAG: hypothetical protein NZ519_05065 [Bacteroidia bacterium]|nr:hypothetical protein [Bacteroidia bacterium]
MTRTIYEAYNETMIVQFLDAEQANMYAQEHDMQVRLVEQDYQEPVPAPRTLTTTDWLNLEQALYQHQSILNKAINSTGNGFTFLLKVLTDGKTTGASEAALQLAINMLLPAMNEPLTEAEKDYINQQLAANGFNITIS